MPRKIRTTRHATRTPAERRPHAAVAMPETPLANKAAAVTTTTESPLDYMLRVMRDPNEDEERRDAMAKAALPYLHARLSNADGQVSDNEGGTITFTWQPPQK
jgi:hypothetical protein